MSEGPARLRVAVMINPGALLRWQHRMLERLQSEGFAEIVLVLVRGEVRGPPRPPPRSGIGAALFHRYAAWDRGKFRLDNDPFAPVPLAELSGEPAVWTIVPKTTTWSDTVADADVERIRGQDIDLIVRLGWRIVRGSVLSVPRHGVWSYHHGDNRVNRGGPPCFWETVHREPVTGLTLQRLGEELDAGLVLARASTATDPVSVNLTRSRLYWLSVEILPEEVARLHRLGAERFFARARVRNRAPSFYSRPLLSERDLSLRDTLTFIAGRLHAYVTRAIFARRFEEKWVLYLRSGTSMSTSLRQFERLESGNDRYWADPHLIERDGRFYAFVEEYPYATRRAHISVIPIDPDGTAGEARVVLEEPHHLSYPFVFEHEGRTFMVPESGANRTVDLYECTDFPDTWVQVGTLMRDVHAVDTTLFRRDGRWWMFTAMCRSDSGHTHDRLHLFSAADLLSDEWLPHPQNAIVSDPARARPAGPLFEVDGSLYRPAQDCVGGYGVGIRLMEITELTTERYSEHEAGRITPEWAPGLHGVHTLSHVPGMTIVDAKTFSPRGDIDFAP